MNAKQLLEEIKTYYPEVLEEIADKTGYDAKIEILLETGFDYAEAQRVLEII